MVCISSPYCTVQEYNVIVQTLSFIFYTFQTIYNFIKIIKSKFTTAIIVLACIKMVQYCACILYNIAKKAI